MQEHSTIEDGPHECPFDEDYDWWVDLTNFYFKGHKFEFECLECGAEGSTFDVIEQSEVLIECDCVISEVEDFTYYHELLISPWSHISNWQVFGNGAVQGELEVKDGYAVATIPNGDEESQWKIESETYFKEIQGE